VKCEVLVRVSFACACGWNVLHCVCLLWLWNSFA